METRPDRITIEAGKCGGKPCIRGTRMRVSDVLDLLASGASYEEVVREYPFLEREDVLAAIAYAASLTDRTILRSTTGGALKISASSNGDTSVLTLRK